MHYSVVKTDRPSSLAINKTKVNPVFMALCGRRQCITIAV